MYTIENEFEDCCRAIQQQTHQKFEHFVIHNKPNKEAHDELYETFMDHADEFDLFIKIDADMILTRNTFFEEIVNKFRQNAMMCHLTIAVQDFFTDRSIWGLHVYRNNIKWVLDKDQILVDRCKQNVFQYTDDSELAPAALHSPDPSPLQAFHFGLHKALKVIQVGSDTFNPATAQNHWKNISRVARKYRKTKDSKLLLVLCGAKCAFAGEASVEQINYGDSTLARLLKQYQDRIDHSRFRTELSVARLLYYPSNIQLSELIAKRQSLNLFDRCKYFMRGILRDVFETLRSSEHDDDTHSVR